MPEIKKNEDGTVEVKYETGETFTGDPIDVLNKVGEAHVSTKRWAQNIKSENENLKAQHLNPPAPQPPAQPVNQDEAALDTYLLERHAKALGFKSGDEYRQRLEFINNTTDRQSNEQVAADFMLACPEFTGEPEAVNKLAAKIDEMGWQYDSRSLMAAHLMCMREGAYKVLTTDEVNMAANNSANQTASQINGRTVPPTPPPPGSPGQQPTQDPWQMTTDELRKKVLEQGGLGRALMELPPGGTLGQG